VQQFAYDIYDLRGSEPINVEFIGTTKAAVLENVVAASGDHMWYSGRANEATMTLTQEFDLSGLDSATLEYDVNYKIEGGWDFVYTLVSTDGGETWQALAGEGMNSDADDDDPAELSLADSYFTGVTGSWTHITSDLTPYVGQTVQVRFQYVTDAVYTQASFVLDNIAIPELDFYDDVEGGAGGWAAQGFTRVTSYTQQPFYLVLVQFDEAGQPYSTRVELAEDNTATINLPFSEDNRRAFLVVAAGSPVITSSAAYQVNLSK
jgi:bacillopeptidase F (M6 metalloprotease family)